MSFKAYTAGYFDGEGSIQITVDYTLRISIGNTCLSTIKWLHSIWGGNLYEFRAPTSKRRVLRLNLSGSAAANFLYEILPYLHDKKRRALLVLSFYRYKRLYKLGRGSRSPRDKKILKRREAYKKSLSVLNHR